jgi:hypothetical protein
MRDGGMALCVDDLFNGIEASGRFPSVGDVLEGVERAYRVRTRGAKTQG